MIADIDTTEINAWLNVGTIIGLIALGIVNKIDARKAVKAATVSAKIAIETKLLVNSNMAIQLRKAMLQSRRIADMTGKSDDVRVADEDEQLYKRHIAAQAVIDAANELVAHAKQADRNEVNQK